jgi:excisionase family DNA binding protein
MTTFAEEIFLSSSEFAEIAGVARRTVTYWITTGRIKAHRFCKKYRIPLSEFTKVVKNVPLELGIPVAQEDLSGLPPALPTPDKPWRYYARLS